MTVAVGLAATGVSTLVMMSLSARALSTAEYAAFAVWWTVATFFGTGFGVFETYLARLMVTEVSSGRDPRHVIGLMLGRAVVAATLIALGLLVLAPWLADLLFAGSMGLALVLPLAVALMAGQALQRGAATGQGRFPAIAGQLVTEGFLRATLTVGLIVLERESVVGLAIGTCLASACGLVVGGRMVPHWLASPRIRDADIPTRPLGYLLVAAIGPLLANNASLPWLAATGTQDAVVLGAFAGALTLSRLPTQFVSAAFAPLLAQLSQCVEVGDWAMYRRLRRLALGASALFGVIFVGLFAGIGSWLLSAYLGPQYDLSVGVLAALAGASGMLFMAYVDQAVLSAHHRWSAIAASWTAATAVFVAILSLPLDELALACTAPLLATSVAFGIMTTTASKQSLRPSG